MCTNVHISEETQGVRLRRPKALIWPLPEYKTWPENSPTALGTLLHKGGHVLACFQAKAVKGCHRRRLCCLSMPVKGCSKHVCFKQRCYPNGLPCRRESASIAARNCFVLQRDRGSNCQRAASVLSRQDGRTVTHAKQRHF